ncbi:MAG: response regulator transcription factor, partial [Candidatus Paceibacterota bacterium]
GQEDALLAGEYVKDILPEIKILFLSKKGEIKDRIQGLETAGDDYLPKPFSLAELRLRVRSLLAMQRATEQGRRRWVVGELVFYPDQGLVETPGRKAQLRRRETEILECLVQAAGATVSRQQLTRVLWPASYEPNSSTVDVYIRRIRQKLGELSYMLQTCRGFGYRLVDLKREV